ncbi:unnamed protein product [Lota lota]
MERMRILPLVLLGLVRPSMGTVFPWSQNSCPPVGDSLGPAYGQLFWEPLKLSDIKWNFEKFLVGPDGKPVRRWHPKVIVSTVRKFIIDYLQHLHGERDSN